MSILNTLTLIGGLLSLPVNEGDVVEVSTNKGTFYGKIRRLGNNSLTMSNNVTIDVDDINGILQY